jgi:hypothetical protein
MVISVQFEAALSLGFANPSPAARPILCFFRALTIECAPPKMHAWNTKPETAGFSVPALLKKESPAS